MQRGAAAKVASTPEAAPDPATTVAAAAAATAAPAAASTSAEGSAPGAAPKKVKGWLGVPQTGGESEWVLPSSTVDDAWGEVAPEGGAGIDSGRLEVEESYLPFVLGRHSGGAVTSGASGSGGGKGGRWSYGGLNRDVEVRSLVLRSRLSAVDPSTA